jgi:hypothetical protein
MTPVTSQDKQPPEVVGSTTWQVVGSGCQLRQRSTTQQCNLQTVLAQQHKTSSRTVSYASAQQSRGKGVNQGSTELLPTVHCMAPNAFN